MSSLSTSLRPEARPTTTVSSAEPVNVLIPSQEVPLVGLMVIGALLAAILFWLLKPKTSNDSQPVDEATKLPPLKLSPNRPSLPPQPQRFEAKTAKPIPQKLCIEGRARITDGDTIVIRKTQIRLFGIDAPELNHPYGQNAKWAMVKLCKGQTIRAEVTEVDRYGRTVARCYLPDGRDLSAELVKQGLAIDWHKFSGGVYRTMEVKDARRKMWLADARQKGRMHVWEQFEARNRRNN